MLSTHFSRVRLNKWSVCTTMQLESWSSQPDSLSSRAFAVHNSAYKEFMLSHAIQRLMMNQTCGFCGSYSPGIMVQGRVHLATSFVPIRIHSGFSRWGIAYIYGLQYPYALFRYQELFHWALIILSVTSEDRLECQFKHSGSWINAFRHSYKTYYKLYTSIAIYNIHWCTHDVIL
jgi:hypothetical protein